VVQYKGWDNPVTGVRSIKKQSIIAVVLSIIVIGWLAVTLENQLSGDLSHTVASPQATVSEPLATNHGPVAAGQTPDRPESDEHGILQALGEPSPSGSAAEPNQSQESQREPDSIPSPLAETPAPIESTPAPVEPTPSSAKPTPPSAGSTLTSEPTSQPPTASGAASSPGPSETKASILPEGFVYITDIIPDVRLEIRYATDHNFTGQVVPGYLSSKAILSREAAVALKKVADSLREKGYGILVYDAYRPKQAVSSFIEWAEEPEDWKTKEEFYPDIDKQDLFKLSYLAKRSGHSRGSTIDLTLFSLADGQLLDMGSPYDFLGPISNHGTNLITAAQTENRNILKNAMKAAGFKELRTEWWHYGLSSEPYPDTYFDFPVQ